MRTEAAIERQEVALKEEKKLLKAEAAFMEKKAAGKVTPDDKKRMYEIRRNWRLNYRLPKTGAAVDAIGADATPGEVG